MKLIPRLRGISIVSIEARAWMHIVSLSLTMIFGSSIIILSPTLYTGQFPRISLTVMVRRKGLGIFYTSNSLKERV